MSTGEPLVVCINHPPDADVSWLRARLAGLERPVEILLAPYKENLRLRIARRTPPVPPELLATAPGPDAGLIDAWSRCEALMALDVPHDIGERAPRLRWVQGFGAGIEHLGAAALLERGIEVATAAGAGAGSIAEFVMGRLLEVWKQTRAVEAMQRERRFTRPASRTLEGATLGIVGLGAIGSAVARRAAAFGMRVLATRRRWVAGQTAPDVDELLGPDGLPRLLAESDALVLCAPDTPQTRDLIDGDALAAMRPGAVLVNVARGTLVDEDALAGALETRALGAAILDVTRVEPLPADSPLWDAPGLYLSPHCAVAPDSYARRAVELFAENVERWARGEPLRNRVEPDAL